MAIKYYCDGCDDEIKQHPPQHNKVRIEFETEIVNLDLCNGCANRVNPKKWPRASKPARAIT